MRRQLELRFLHSLKKGKDSLETWAVVLVFLLELKIFGVAVHRYGSYTKTAKNSDFCEELHSENDFEAAFFFNLLTGKLWVWSLSITGFPEMQARFPFLFLTYDKNE